MQMSTLSTFMSSGHKTCDEAFAIAEEAALGGNWHQASDAFNAFHNDMAQHFRMEEEILFPALISSGGPSGPVSIMLMEHAQMNELIEQMADSVAGQDAEEYGGLSETLLISLNSSFVDCIGFIKTSANFFFNFVTQSGELVWELRKIAHFKQCSDL